MRSSINLMRLHVVTLCFLLYVLVHVHCILLKYCTFYFVCLIFSTSCLTVHNIYQFQQFSYAHFALILTELATTCHKFKCVATKCQHSHEQVAKKATHFICKKKIRSPTWYIKHTVFHTSRIATHHADIIIILISFAPCHNFF